MRSLRILMATLRISIQNQMAYRLDWFTQVAQTIVSMATTIGSLWIVFAHTDNLAGWNMREIAALLGVFYIIQGLVGLFLAPSMSRLMTDVRDGTLDFLLVRPVSAQYYASIQRFSILRITDVVIGFGVLGISLYHLAEIIRFTNALSFVLLLVCGMVILYSVWLALVTMTFWVVRVFNIQEIIWQAIEAGRYPIDIYPRWIRFGLSYIIPVGFVITMPSRSLLGRLDWTGMLSAIFLAIITFTLATAFWRMGLRRYCGASA